LGMRKGKKYMVMKGTTGPDGFWPSRNKYKRVPSGSLRMTVTKAGWYNITWFDKRYKDWTDIIVPPTEKTFEQVVLKRLGEKHERFEPKIWTVKPGKYNGRDVYEYEWKIDA
jgi:hypothetical protein